MLSHVRGLICPLVTPFNHNGDIDHAAVRSLVDFLLAQGVDVLFPGGSTGEGLLLSITERKALAETVLDQVAGRVPVIVHTGAMRTDETIDLTRHARDAGATAASVITPFFFTYTDDMIRSHYATVARAVPDFPIFVYAFPGNAKNDVTPAVMQQLRQETESIVGVKSSNPSLLRFQEYIAAGGADFVPLCGVDGLMLAALAVGSHGQVSGNSNVWPEVFRQLYDAFQAGDLAKARACQAQINTLRDLVQDGLHPAAFKIGLSLRGIAGGRVRAPMREMTGAEQSAIAEGLRRLGVI